jgi:hypothetical protein
MFYGVQIREFEGHGNTLMLLENLLHGAGHCPAETFLDIRVCNLSSIYQSIAVKNRF